MKRKRKPSQQEFSAEQYRNSGDLKVLHGKFRDAIADYDRAIQINPDYSEAYYNRGQAKSHLELHEAAIADYNEAIRLNPKEAEAHNNRGLAKVLLVSA